MRSQWMGGMLLSGILAALCAGCASGTEPVPGLVGRYELVSVNGGTLPQAILSDGLGFHLLTRASMHLRASSYAETTWTRYQTASVVEDDSVAVAGFYALDGDSIRITPTGGVPFAVSARDGRLARFVPRQPMALDLTLVYERR